LKTKRFGSGWFDMGTRDIVQIGNEIGNQPSLTRFIKNNELLYRAMIEKITKEHEINTTERGTEYSTPQVTFMVKSARHFIE
jgi:hypothetical protein